MKIILLICLLVVSVSAQARTTIRFGSGNDKFYFHGQVTKYDPLTGERATPERALELFASPEIHDYLIEISNSEGLIYSQMLPAGSCISRGSGGCVYRNPNPTRELGGISRFRVAYQTRNKGFRFWTESYGDCSRATLPNMILTMRAIDLTGAIRWTGQSSSTFSMIGAGRGWTSKY